MIGIKFGKEQNLAFQRFLEKECGSSFFSSSDSSSSSGRSLLRAMTSGSRRRTGHVVNLVHVRSRSLSHAQLPSINVQSNETNKNPRAENSLSVEQVNEIIPKKMIARPSALFRSSVMPITTAPGVIFTPRSVEEAIQQMETVKTPKCDSKNKISFTINRSNSFLNTSGKNSLPDLNPSLLI